jgi:predicted NUDIX family NTP pyrophosphohydrolase
MASKSAENNIKNNVKKGVKKSAKKSAGVLMFRRIGESADVLLVHPGGPFWAKKDDGAWSIPKGLFDEGEDALTAAKREFEEETGQRPDGAFIELGMFKQPSGKEISAFAIEGTFDLESFKSNSFAMEWPPRSGRMTEFPEADRAGWFGPQQALEKITKGQRPIVQSLFERLGLSPR